MYRTHAAFFFAWCQACEVFIQSARYRWIPVKPFKVPVHHSFSNSSKYSDTWHVSRKFSTRHAEICCHQQLFFFTFHFPKALFHDPQHTHACTGVFKGRRICRVWQHGRVAADEEGEVGGREAELSHLPGKVLRLAKNATCPVAGWVLKSLSPYNRV